MRSYYGSLEENVHKEGIVDLMLNEKVLEMVDKAMIKVDRELMQIANNFKKSLAQELKLMKENIKANKDLVREQDRYIAKILAENSLKKPKVERTRMNKEPAKKKIDNDYIPGLDDEDDSL